MKYLSTEEINFVQIDHTSRCNLMCPQCARVYKGQVNPEMPLGELTVDDYKRIWTPELIKNVHTHVQCGNYGDIVASHTILECLDWLRSQGSEANIIILTNGSARNKEWWTELSRIIGKRGKIVFSVDGMADTNPMYRVNSNFEKIMENAKTVIDAGVKTRWDYLVFGHNEHQIDEAKAFAKQLGFREFSTKLTNRFINEKNYTGQVNKHELKEDVKTRKGEYAIKASEKHKPQSASKFEWIVENYGSWDNYVNQTKIDCKFRNKNGIFVDFEARLWPCTWTASGMYHYGQNQQKDQLYRLLDHYGWDFNDLRQHTLEEVINHEWYKEQFVKSWNLTMDDRPIEKLMCCGRTCGTDYEFSSASDQNKQTEMLNA